MSTIALIAAGAALFYGGVFLGWLMCSLCWMSAKSDNRAQQFQEPNKV